jgi:membrane protease YdiL (CAAX protease family)/REP element-mobilizing transposase RayT
MPDSAPLLDQQPLASNSVHAKGPWGAGMTLVFGFVIFLAYSVIQSLAMAPVLMASLGPRFNAAQVADIMTLGFNLALATAIGCPAMLILCGLIIIARGGPSLESYLALHRTRPARLFAWMVGMLAFVLSMSALNEALQRPVADFISRSFATAGHLPFFFVAVGLCAPIAEEVFFRGFIYRGLAQSPTTASPASWIAASSSQPAEKEHFVRLLRECEAFCEVRVLTYCLMSNHFHVLVEVPRRPPPEQRPSAEQVLAKLAKLSGHQNVGMVRQRFEMYRQAHDAEGEAKYLATFHARMWDVSEFIRVLKQRFTLWYNVRTGARARCGRTGSRACWWRARGRR